MTVSAIERLARVIYEAVPEGEDRPAGEFVRIASGYSRVYEVFAWEDLPDKFPYARERALKQAQAVLDFATQGVTP